MNLIWQQLFLKTRGCVARDECRHFSKIWSHTFCEFILMRLIKSWHWIPLIKNNKKHFSVKFYILRDEWFTFTWFNWFNSTSNTYAYIAWKTIFFSLGVKARTWNEHLNFQLTKDFFGKLKLLSIEWQEYIATDILFDRIEHLNFLIKQK